MTAMIMNMMKVSKDLTILVELVLCERGEKRGKMLISITDRQEKCALTILYIPVSFFLLHEQGGQGNGSGKDGLHAAIADA